MSERFPRTPIVPDVIPWLPPESRRAEHLLLALWCVLLFGVAFGIGIRHHRFPCYYHPDESGKATQVITGKFNFHHPMLLLGTSRLAADLCHTPSEMQAIVEVGRSVSAAFMAGAVVMFSIVAYMWRGWRPCIVTGAALTLSHQLYELGHYMKEDSALLFGMAAAFLCAYLYAQKASVWRAALLGVACALAVSGKYLGIVSLAVALPVLWAGSQQDAATNAARSLPWIKRRPGHLTVFAGTLLLVFAAVNFAMLFHFVTFSSSLHREINLVVKGQGDSTRRIPHSLYWNVFLDNSTPAIWVLLLALYTVCVQRWARITLYHRLLICFPVAYALALSFSPKENDRYFLPATALFTLLAAIGLEAGPMLLSGLSATLGSGNSRRWMEPTRRRWTYALLATVLLALQITGWSPSKPGWSQYDSAFVRDDIVALLTWVRTELPASAVIVADARTGLPKQGRKPSVDGGSRELPQKLIVAKLAAEKGTLASLREQGVTHVAISESSYGRFFRRDLRPKQQKEKNFLTAKQFYEELLRTGDLLFERERSTVIYLHPGIRVYRIAAAEE